MQDLAEPIEVAGLERGLELERQLLDRVELREAVAGPARLLGEDRVRLARLAGEEQVQAGGELAQLVARQRAAPSRRRAPSRRKRKLRRPAVGGDVLVLLADRLAQALDLDLAGLAREALGRHLLAAVGVEGVRAGPP